ncbi:hypothetical protein L9F63_000107, partial [Diploptera punctata]
YTLLSLLRWSVIWVIRKNIFVTFLVFILTVLIIPTYPNLMHRKGHMTWMHYFLRTSMYNIIFCNILLFVIPSGTTCENHQDMNPGHLEYDCRN